MNITLKDLIEVLKIQIHQKSWLFASRTARLIWEYCEEQNQAINNE